MDRKLPGLITALNDVEMYDVFSRYLDRIDVPGLDRVEHSLVKYKPGKRCVLEFRLWRGNAYQVFYGKLFRKNRGEQIFANLTRLWQQWKKTDEQPLMPEPVAYISELGMVLQKQVCGTPFLEFERPDNLFQAVRYAAHTLAALHELPVVDLQKRSLVDHFKKFARPSIETVAEDMPELNERLQRLVTAFQVAAREERPERYRIVHGDLNPMQILVRDDKAYFVDFDGVCLSHPALDVSNFLIALKVRFPSMANELTRYFLENYLHRCPSANLRGLRMYHALIYFRRAMIAFRQYRHTHRKTGVQDYLQKAISYLSKETTIVGD